MLAMSCPWAGGQILSGKGFREPGAGGEEEKPLSQRQEAHGHPVLHTLQLLCSFNSYSMSTVYVSGKVVSARDLVVSRRALFLHEAY